MEAMFTEEAWDRELSAEMEKRIVEEPARERGILKVARGDEVVDVPPLIEAFIESKRKLDALHERIHELGIECPAKQDCIKRQNHGFQPGQATGDGDNVELQALRDYVRMLQQQQKLVAYPQQQLGQQIYPQAQQQVQWTTPNTINIVPNNSLTGTTNPQWYNQLLGQAGATGIGGTVKGK